MSCVSKDSDYGAINSFSGNESLNLDLRVEEVPKALLKCGRAFLEVRWLTFNLR